MMVNAGDHIGGLENGFRMLPDGMHLSMYQ